MSKQKPFVFRFFSVLTAFVFGFYIFFAFVFTPVKVSAVSNIGTSIPSGSEELYNSYLNELLKNPNFAEISSGIVFFSAVNGNGEIGVFVSDLSGGVVELPSAWPSHLGGTLFLGRTASFSCRTTELATVYFPLSSNYYYGTQAMYSNDFSSYCTVFVESYDQGETFSINSFNTGWYCRILFDNAFNPYFESVPLFLHVDVDDFYTWIINNNKLSELPSYIVQSKLKSFIQFYQQTGSDSNAFITRIVDWFNHVNIVSQTLENRRILKSAIDNLYRQYLDYRSSTHAYWPGATKLQERDSIDTVTNNNNTSLITDDSNDDIYTKLLRDILRGVISISNNVVQGCANIVTKLDQLDFTVAVSNSGGSSGTNIDPILNKMDDIINALGSDTVSVEIDQTTKDDTDDFFDDWNLQFSTALNNKFPVASQLRTFFTGFFERCGIDADSDGEVYQYYNPSTLRAGSNSSSSEEETIVNDFLSNFGGADPAFLDDASFHGVPDLSVSVGGQSVSIIDFRVYAKYRDKIHFIISFVIWTLYLLHLYKALPSIIGQVADVATKTSEL